MLLLRNKIPIKNLDTTIPGRYNVVDLMENVYI